MRINTNLSSLQAQRHLSNAKFEQDEVLAKLSSGSRINKAADDAAGLAISEKLKADIRGTKQAERNANDGISMIQIAEGGMNEISNILVRLRELSVQAASDTIGDEERKFTNLEFQNLTKEVDRIAHSTTFNGKHLLNGSAEAFDFQVGTGSSKYDRLTFSAEKANSTASHLGLENLSVLTKEDAVANLDVIDKAMSLVSGGRAEFGAMQSRLTSTINNLQVKHENISAANSRIRDTDMAEASAAMTKASILSASGISVLAQANNTPNAALKLVG